MASLRLPPGVVFPLYSGSGTTREIKGIAVTNTTASTAPGGAVKLLVEIIIPNATLLQAEQDWPWTEDQGHFAFLKPATKSFGAGGSASVTVFQSIADQPVTLEIGFDLSKGKIGGAG